MASLDNPWKDHASSLVFRGYQEHAFASFVRSQEEGSHRFYLVAPPGSGKTLLGLSIAEQLACPALVLSPNAAIQTQWLDRLREHWVCVDPVLEAFSPHPSHGADLADGDGPRAVLSLTYQRLAVKGNDGGHHPNVLRLHRRLAEVGIGVLLLDECHHLTGSWGESVRALLQALGSVHVVGLTATPVEQREGPLAEYFSVADHNVSLPSVIRSGDLTPFQDLCQVVEPAPEESAWVEGCLTTFEHLFSRLVTSESDRDSLSVFCEDLVFHGRLEAGVGGNPVALLRRRPELVISACRFVVEAGMDPPEELPPLPELMEPPALDDQLRVAAFYTAFYLWKHEEHLPLRDALRDALAAFGYAVTDQQVRRVQGDLSRVLGHSRQKLVGMEAILQTEARFMGEDLCALILTDYEFPPDGSPALSCQTVMARLTSHSELDALDPVMLTGRSFLVDDDLWPVFAKEAERFFRRSGQVFDLRATPEHGYLRVDAEGPDWNSRTRVALATHLLETGISRCLTGTRALLGEGWDCRRLNTLIDLTVAASPVSVNQVRGRTLRADPEQPLKVANNWDVLCVSALGGFADLDRLVEKHRHLYGVTDDGQIERGLGHIHASLNRLSQGGLLEDRDAINESMHQRAADRLGARSRWRVGDVFVDQTLQVVSFAPARGRAPAARTKAPPREVAGEAAPAPAFVWSRDRREAHRRGRWLQGLGVSGCVAALATLAFAPTAAIPACLSVLGPSLAALVWGAVLKRRSRGGRPFEEDLRELGQILIEALYPSRSETEVVLDRRDDGSLRCVFDPMPAAEAERAGVALAELLAPVRAGRYLLVESVAQDAPAGALGSLSSPKLTPRVYSVPRAFSTRPEVDRLLQAWRRRRDTTARVLHRNHRQAKALLANHLHVRPLGGEVSLHTLWR